MDFAVRAVAVAHHPPGGDVALARGEPARVVRAVGQDPDAGYAEEDRDEAFDDEEGLPVLYEWVGDIGDAIGYPAAKGACEGRC